MEYLYPKITEDGFKAIDNAKSNGVDLVFKWVSFGSSSYNPTGKEKKLKLEKQRVQISDGKKEGLYKLSLPCILDGPLEYEINEIGLFLADGTLFSILSKEGVKISVKIANEQNYIGLNVFFKEITTDKIKIEGMSDRIDLSFAEEFVKMATVITKMQTELIDIKSKLIREGIL